MRLTLLLWTQLISVTWTVNLSFVTNIVMSWCQIHMQLLYCVNAIFKNWERKSKKVNFLIADNKKVNFSYWLSFLLLSWASYMFISISSFFSFFSDIFVLSLTLKTRLNHSLFLSTTRTKSLCQNHHRKSLDHRPVRSFISIHCHQQHHSHQKHWMHCNL